jgi:hypothetical protein
MSYFSRIDPYELALSGRLWTFTFQKALTGSEVVNLQIKTGTKTATILNYEIASSSEPLLLEFVEAPTITNGTTAVTPYNLNRQKNTTPSTVFYSNPTSISEGTVVHYDIVTAGKGAGAAHQSGEVWTLKTSTSYLLRLTQSTNQATKLTVSLLISEDFQTV